MSYKILRLDNGYVKAHILFVCLNISLLFVLFPFNQ